MSHVLIVEDEAHLAKGLQFNLEAEGHSVAVVGDGERALDLLLGQSGERAEFDAVVLDVMLPELDGLEVCKKLRADSKTAVMPIIMVTAKGEETDKIVGLELGADDYLTKPFSPKELMARVKALLRRTEPSHGSKVQTYVYGDLHLDAVKHEVLVKSKEVSLTAKEFGLLEQFLQNKGRILTRDILLDRVWGYDADVTTRTVDVHVRRLREKIPLLADAILTVKSYGYKLKEEG